MNFLKKSNAKLTEWAKSRPSTLIVLFPFYGLAILVSMVLSLFVALAIIRMGLNHDSGENFFGLLSLIFTFVIFGHLLFLTLVSFLSNSRIEGDVKSIINIGETLLLTVFVFAVGYYYLQLHSNNAAIYGITKIDMSGFKDSYSLGQIIERKMLLLPSYEVVIDCIYFSVVTITTLGYGEMHPISPAAKIVVCLEVIAGFVLIVLSLGSVIGKVSSGSSRGA